MRDELHLMELVDRYLDGGMGAAEGGAFEERMRMNGELQGLVNEQRALREGLHRVQLRHALASAHRTWTIRRWMPWMVAGLVLLTTAAWLMRSPLEHDARIELPPARISEVPNGTDAAIAVSDSLPERLDLDIRVETMFTRTSSRAELWKDTACGDSIVTRLITDQGEAVDERVPTEQQVEQEGTVPAVSATSARAVRDQGDEDDLFHVVKLDQARPADAEPITEKMILATVERFENATKPEFPGGYEGMQRFILANIKQPRGTKKSGTVAVGFTVNKKGEVANVEVVQSLGRAFDVEAVRVVTSMPQWAPSRIGDRPVKSKLKVHVRFKGVPKERATGKRGDGPTAK